MQVQAILGRKGSDVATIEPGATIRQAVERLREYGIGALVVSADGSSIAGIISERDIVRRIAADGDAALEMDVTSGMTSNVITCAADDSVEVLMRQMTEARIRHLPVVDAEARMQGIVSIGDLVKVRLGELESENRELADYITNRH